MRKDEERVHPYIPNSVPAVQREMLAEIGAASIEELYQDILERFDSPRGETYYFLQGTPVEGPLEEGSDWHAVSQGAVSKLSVTVVPSPAISASTIWESSREENPRRPAARG